MDEEAIKEGDVVYLKSGGPALTVTAISGGNMAHVAWTAEHGPIMRDSFSVTSLSKKKPIRS